MNKKKEQDSPKISEGKVNIVAQELKFAKLLACNDQKIRNNVLKSLKKWLKTRSQSSYQFTNKDFLRLWKGLYYCMWMSDKPLVQEELSEELGSLIHCFPDIKISIQFFQQFLETMCLEWFGIDQWRIDKFMMLIRRVTRQMLFALKNADYEDEIVKLYTNALEKTIFHTTKCPKGLIMHICDFYIEEIAKVSDGELSEERTHALIEPFLVYYTKLTDHILLRHIEKQVFEQLLYQSELGQEFQETFDVWKKADFPTKSIDDIEINYQVRGNKSFTDDDLSDGEEEDEEERALDPRAGRVNVTLMEIKFDALKLAETLDKLRYKPFASSKSRKGLARMAVKLRKFAHDEFPLGVHKIPHAADDDNETVDIDLKAIQLAEFEQKLAIGGDMDSEGSDIDEDLDNRKHGKLKRKSKDENKSCKTMEKKQKLSKLHTERFFQAESEDFTKDQTVRDDDDEEGGGNEEVTKKDIKVKSNKKKTVTNGNDDEVTSRVKIQKRKLQNKEVKPLKAMKMIEDIPTSDETFKVKDDWSTPLKEGEVEMFVPSRKQKLKALQSEGEASSGSKKMKRNDKLESFVTPPRISSAVSASATNTGKRVKIALNKNQAQTAHEYIKQVKQSPNLPTNNLLMKPIKSVLKPNSLPSPINPFYQKKLANFNKTF